MELSQDLPLYKTGSESDDESDDMETLGTSGLINIGNTCYMNSIIQCLSNCDEFRIYIIGSNLISQLIDNETEYYLAEKTINNSLAFQLRKIFINIWNSSFYSFRPISFKKLFGTKIELFQNSNQHDSQEALLCILDSIHEELAIESEIIVKNKNLIFDCLDNLHDDEDTNIDSILKIIQSNKNEYLHYKSVKDFKTSHKKFSKINDLFEGRTISQLTCSETNGIKTNFESFFYFTLTIPNNEDTELSDSDESDDEHTSDSTKSLDNVSSEDPVSSNDITSSENHTSSDDQVSSEDHISSIIMSGLSDDNVLYYNKSVEEEEDSDKDSNEEEEDSDKDSNEEEEEEEEENEEEKEEEEENEEEEEDEEEEDSDDEMKFEDSDDDLDKPYNIDRIKSLLGKQTKLDIKHNLYDLLDNYIIPEQLNAENKWNSPYAKKKVDAEKLNLIWETPKILIFLIKRFEYSYTGAKKLNNLIDFPIDNLNISKYLHPNHVSKYSNYSLFAINNHTNFNNMGFNGISFGHYYSYCKNYTDNKWYNFDDSNVDEIDKSKLITNNAYMLFYKANE